MKKYKNTLQPHFVFNLLISIFFIVTALCASNVGSYKDIVKAQNVI